MRAPAIALPEGGGAIRGIGEKFSSNPVTGTGSLQVPIATSPGRSGFGPQLALTYDSGAGNGPFGLGWDLSLPAITRKTEKGLPRYRDGAESDVFTLAGAEDLVPLLVERAGEWVRAAPSVRTVGGVAYRVERYRPRVESDFARIERWTNVGDPADVCWRSLTGANVTSWYGKSADARIADPAAPERIFSWLICESSDDKGNVVAYVYKGENGDSVDLGQVAERNRERTANRYPKRIRYGNQAPYRPLLAPDAPRPAPPGDGGWHFEVVFDYGEHEAAGPGPAEVAVWPVRPDPFSVYRPGFEVRTYRLCRRVLMFHHFPAEPAVGADCLVRSVDLSYDDGPAPADSGRPILSCVRAVTQTGYRRQGANGYRARSLPPLELRYSEARIRSELRELDAASGENLPAGVDGATSTWIDLDGEGLSGVLTEQGNAWFYKRNLSPLPLPLPFAAPAPAPRAEAATSARFGPGELLATRPAATLAGRAQLLDLAGDGRPDLVQLDGPVPGFYHRTADERWAPFVAFEALPVVDWHDPNLRFVDLDGDGHADVLIGEEQAWTWHRSLAEAGFGPPQRTSQPADEERGPRVVFADGTQSIYLADMVGDGLMDIVRVRNGDICYWPNLGYGSFGSKVTMDGAPWLDAPDRFDQRRVRLADIDGSGVTDLLYLHADGVRVYFNLSGNGWSAPTVLTQMPDVEDLAAVQALDLLGNGTACLVWSSPWPDRARHPIRYVDLMGGLKPHLLVGVANNLGAERQIRYAPSTRFYLADRAAGRPWITRLPFPVAVVERVITYDHISRTRFTTRFAYHHGYFDGAEREFRGFGMVEQWDTEELAPLGGAGGALPAANEDPASHVPPVLTRTWFHTGVYVDREHIANFFAGLLDPSDPGEYYREPAWRNDDVVARAHLLEDAALPAGLSGDEEREACRALKGVMLRQEVYARDGTDRADHPYTVVEQGFTIRCLQPRGEQRHAAFHTRARETLRYQYERNPDDPRLGHTLTLEVDDFGNVLKEATVGYGRRRPAPDLALPADRDRQTASLVTYTERRYANAIDVVDAYRTPLPCEIRSCELTGYRPTGPAGRYAPSDFVAPDPTDPTGRRQIHRFDGEIPHEDEADDEVGAVPGAGRQRRPLAHDRTLYRKDDLTGLLPLGVVEPRALPGESYRLALTPGLLTRVYRRPTGGGVPEALLPDPGAVLPAVPGVPGRHGDRAGYVESDTLRAAGLFPPDAADPRWRAGDADGHWWAPAGRIFYAPLSGATAAQELAEAQRHFFVPRRYLDPFGQPTTVTFDAYDLLLIATRDPLGNLVTAGERDAAGAVDPARPGSDYRVLQPWLVADANRNRTMIGYDALGLVTGTATAGKAGAPGDSLDGFDPDLMQAQVDAFFDSPDPHLPATGLLGAATTRTVFDVDRFWRSRLAWPDDPSRWLPTYTASVARETHAGEPLPPGGQRVQVSFAYADGFGRIVQHKIPAEPGPLTEGGPAVTPRWVGSGWTIFDNRGQPVRRYQPFFSQLATQRHRFEYGITVGVCTVLFYDPLGRVVATLYPDNSYAKVVFDPWRQSTYDADDTVAPHGSETGDPRTDPDVKGYVEAYFVTQPQTWQTWFQQRSSGALGQPEQAAATQCALHADTPAVAHFDTLGRPFVTLAHAGFRPDGSPILLPTRSTLDILGRTRAVRDAIVQQGDARGRLLVTYDYDLLGARIYQASMEAGRRWTLADVAGLPVRTWDSRGHTTRTEYDSLRRPLRTVTVGVDPARPAAELVVERLVYGEQHPEAEARNLRQRAYLHLDPAGALTNEAHDLHGNVLRASRRLARDYRQAVDWRAVDADEGALPVDPVALLDPAALEAALAPRLEDETFTTRTVYDALSRPVQIVSPGATRPDGTRTVTQPVYNEARLLGRLRVWLDHPVDPVGLIDPAVVTPSPVGITNLDYDARGQRQRLDYANGATTRYGYDPATFRLISLTTTRPANANGLAAELFEQPGTVQALRYTYDPVGNVTRIADDALPVVIAANESVAPVCNYTYDALYRLTAATGREHVAQSALLQNAPAGTLRDHPFVGAAQLNDRQAVRRYGEAYEYDAVGNFARVVHSAAGGGWTREYTLDETSPLEDGAAGTVRKTSNRLTSTSLGAPPALVESYAYDAHGNVTRLPHLAVHPDPAAPNLHWDHRDRLRQTDLGGGGTAYYVYDAAGGRVRKVWEKAPGLVEERIYLGAAEIFRRRNGAGAMTLERETLHVMDDQQLIALVETRTVAPGGDPAPPRLIRYQVGNHLRSACLELDAQAAVISYEEFTPYGSSAYQAVRSQTETPKRYRYTGKERDEESGLGYHGARYYAPWLGRWISCDPLGLADGVNLYLYVRGQPTRFVDPRGTQSTRPDLPDVRLTRPASLDTRSAEERLKDRTMAGLRDQQSKQLQLPAAAGGPPVDVLSPQERGAILAGARRPEQVKPIPDLVNIPTPDTRSPLPGPVDTRSAHPGPTGPRSDPNPYPADDPSLQRQAGTDPNNDPSIWRGKGEPAQTRRADETDALDHPTVGGVVDKATDVLGQGAVRDVGKLTLGDWFLGVPVVGGILGGAVAGAQSDREVRNGAFDPPRKLTLKLSDRVKLRTTVFDIVPTVPADPLAKPATPPSAPPPSDKLQDNTMGPPGAPGFTRGGRGFYLELEVKF